MNGHRNNINEKLRNELLKWYEKNKYDYPWRTTEDQYRILITEILLQKTIASNVNNIYHTFFSKYNNFSDIKKSKIQDLQEDIKSLGLSNKRAKILKDLSLIVMNNNGKIPEDPKILREVNGIANYVSNAYLCFGLNKKTIFYDVNITRFISRTFNIPKSKERFELIENKLDELIPAMDCKRLYWSILDLCNKICIKSSPKCDMCPVSSYCYYYQNDL